MRRQISRRTIPTLAALGVAALFVAACGSSPASPAAPSAQTSQPALTQADVTRVMASTTSGVGNASAAFAGTMSGLRTSSGPINVPINQQTACPNGGSIGVSGNISGAVSNAGNGQISLNEVVTFSSCLSDGVLLEGDPNITLAGQFTVADSKPVSPVVIRLTNGVTFTYNNVQGSVHYDCTANIDVNTGAGTASGTITIQYPIGTPATTVACSGM